MSHKKTLIIDCDGVLYPSSQISLQDFVSAMKETYRQDLGVSGEIQSQVSAETTAQKKLGMFNYIKAMCEKTGYSFEQYCQKMFDRVDYEKIQQDKALLQLLLVASQRDEVTILTNNHYAHLDKVLRHRFDKSLFEMEDLGIKCYDITSSEQNGVFYPKQDPKGLLLFLQRLDRRPENCVLIDDSPRNIKTAQSIGMRGVLIDEEYPLSAYLSQNYMRSIHRKLGRENG